MIKLNEQSLLYISDFQIYIALTLQPHENQNIKER